MIGRRLGLSIAGALLAMASLAPSAEFGADDAPTTPRPKRRYRARRQSFRQTGYSDAELRAIRARNGVGRPPRRIAA